VEPSFAPSIVPTAAPTAPTVEPTRAPTAPTARPTKNPTAKPSKVPTIEPTPRPTPLPGQPTLAPTVVPTSAAPTIATTGAPSAQTAPVLCFNNTLTMGGVATPTLDESGRKSVVTATAESMDLDDNSVTYVSDTSTAENRRLMSSTDARLRGVSLFTTTYRVSSVTQVSVLLTSSTPAEAAELYAALTTKLVDAVTSGAFTESLHAAAILYNATDVQSAVATNVTSSAPIVQASIQVTPDNSDNDLNGGEIAGIVIGCFVFAALVMAGLYYCMFVRSKATYEGTQVFAPNADVEITL
jgi:hypothetical protein